MTRNCGEEACPNPRRVTAVPGALGLHRLTAREPVLLLCRLARHELAAGQLGEITAALDEFIDRAALDDTAAMKHKDAVGVAHGGESVRDDEGRAAFYHLRQR